MRLPARVPGGPDLRVEALGTTPPSLPLPIIPQTGLKYYEDIQRKMPRTEVARGEALVRAAVFDLVDTLAPGLGADGVARTYAWATGSFRRGAPESSDMDMLVGLPPGTEHVDCVHFLEQVGKEGWNASCGTLAERWTWTYKGRLACIHRGGASLAGSI